MVKVAQKRTDEKATPQIERYRLICYCGASYSGERSKEFQSLQCAECDEKLLVFPGDAYKGLKRPKRKRGGKQSKPLLPETVRKALREAGQIVGGALGFVARFFRRQKNRLVNGCIATVQTIRKELTIVRTALLGVTLLMMAGGAYAWNSYQQQQARQTIQKTGQRAALAVEQGDWELAASHYSEVVKALDHLKWDDLQSQRIRQWGLETMALQKLSSRSLGDLIAEAQQARESKTLDSWLETYQTVYGDSWIVVDAKFSVAQLSLQPEETQSNETLPAPQAMVTVNPLWIDQQRVWIVWPLKTLEPSQFDSNGQRLLLTGAIDKLDWTEEQGWLVILDSKRCGLWANAQSWQQLESQLQLTSPPEEWEQIENVLSTQKQILELTE